MAGSLVLLAANSRGMQVVPELVIPAGIPGSSSTSSVTSSPAFGSWAIHPRHAFAVSSARQHMLAADSTACLSPTQEISHHRAHTRVMHSRLQQTHAPLVHSRADSAGRGRTACARLNTCTEWGAQGTRGVAESNLGHKHDLDMLVDGNRDKTLGGGVARVCWQRRAGPPLKRVAVAERRRGLAPVGHKHWRCLQAQPVRLCRRECAPCAARASVYRPRWGARRSRQNKTQNRVGIYRQQWRGEARSPLL